MRDDIVGNSCGDMPRDLGILRIIDFVSSHIVTSNGENFFMPSCYECGVTTDQVVRREVETGYSHGHRGRGRTYYGKRSLCAECARWHDTKTAIKTIIFIVFLLLLFVGSRETAQSPAPTSPKEQRQKIKEQGEAQKPPLSSAKKNH